jgi:bacterioferritin
MKNKNRGAKDRKVDPGVNEVVAALTKAYWMEIETVINYISNSIDLDGVRAEEIKKSLEVDIAQELVHAQSLAKRIKELGGRIPGSMAFRPGQDTLQPPKRSTDVKAVILGVIDAENAACDHYNTVIRACEGKDYVTQDLCSRLLGEEEAHRREFRGFLLEYTGK